MSSALRRFAPAPSAGLSSVGIPAVPAAARPAAPAWAANLPAVGALPAGDTLAAALCARYARVAGDMPHAAADPLADPRRPVAVLPPDGYEASYAYPLVVWLHDTGATERDLAPIARGVSERNYLGLAVRGVPCRSAAGVHRGGPAFGWPDRAVGDLADRLPKLIAGVRAHWHVHPERIYLAGVGSGADAAADLLAARPGWFAGAALIAGGTLPPVPPAGGDLVPVAPDLTGARVALVGGPGRRDAPRVLAAAAGWRSLGAAAEACLEDDGPLSPAALRTVDRWLMRGVGVGV